MTPMPTVKKKPVRWQFGIRSRNAPWEALLYIHKSLHKLGATYAVDEDYDAAHDRSGQQTPSNDGSFVSNADNTGRGSTASMDPTKRYRLPADPWHIKARWEVSSKSPSPSTRIHGLTSAAIDQTGKASSDALDKETVGTPESFHVTTQGQEPTKKGFVAMHLDIQIYEMEQGVYLADFKCSGYETPEGRLLEEKEVTSPYPFLDMAARLIMQLAEAGSD